MANDSWRTPPQVFNYYNKKHNFQYDVAASDENHLCSRYFTEQQSGLTTDWHRVLTPGDYVWCNPPYSNPLPFVNKCIDEAVFSGIGSVMLLNHDMSVEWSSILATVGCNIDVFIASGSKADKTYCGGRIAFLDAEGNAIKGNNKGQIAVTIPPFVAVGRNATTRYLALSCVMNNWSEQ
jgi:phage N-6-adenine-methyltransferase